MFLFPPRLKISLSSSTPQLVKFPPFMLPPSSAAELMMLRIDVANDFLNDCNGYLGMVAFFYLVCNNLIKVHPVPNPLTCKEKEYIPKMSLAHFLKTLRSLKGPCLWILNHQKEQALRLSLPLPPKPTLGPSWNWIAQCFAALQKQSPKYLNICWLYILRSC